MPALENEGHEAFCQEYVKDFNITAAMFRVRKYKSENVAAVMGCKLLRNVHVARRIKELLTERRKEIQIEADNIIMELAILAFSDVRNVCSWNDGGLNLIPSDNLSPAVSKSIKEVTYHFSDGAGRVSLKMHDKFPALEKLGKHLGIFSDRKFAGDTITEDTTALASQLLSNLKTVLKDTSCQTSPSQSSQAPSSSGLLGGSTSKS